MAGNWYDDLIDQSNQISQTQDAMIKNSTSALGNFQKLMASPAGQGALGSAQIHAGIGGIVGSVFQAKFQREQGKIAAQQAEFNAKMTENAASSRMIAAKENQQQFAVQVGRLRGSQRAGFAGQQVVVNSGSSQRLGEVTQQESQRDMINQMAAARAEALGFKVQAMGYRTQARVAKMESSFASNSTLLSGISKGAGDILAGSMRVASGAMGV